MAVSEKNEEAAGETNGALPLARAIGSRNLIVIIVAMPLVFLVVLLGTILVFGKHDRPAAIDGDLKLPTIEADALSSAASALAPAPLVLPDGAEIQSMAIDGERLVLHTVNAQGESSEIIVYDLERGAPAARIPVIRQIAPDGDF